MIKFENTEVMNWEAAIRGMRNPMNSWEKSDSISNVIVLCGSTRFKSEFMEVQKKLSCLGYCVLSVGLFGHSGDNEAWFHKDALNNVHKQKIRMSSSIFVIDVDNYLGESTKNEIEYAKSLGKKIYYLSKGDLKRIHLAQIDSFIGQNDLELMKKLCNAGTDHRKFMRQIIVSVDITAPLYWWKEFDTYKVGTVANSCSTMHKIHEKEFTMDDFSYEHLFAEYGDPSMNLNYGDKYTLGVLRDLIRVLNHFRYCYIQTKDKKYWWQMIQLLPSSYNQRRTITFNYEVLANIYGSRKNHKLDEWSVGFMDWVKSLPYSELITGEFEEIIVND